MVSQTHRAYSSGHIMMSPGEPIIDTPQKTEKSFSLNLQPVSLERSRQISKDFGSTGFSDKTASGDYRATGVSTYMSERKPGYYARRQRLDLDVIAENEDDERRQSSAVHYLGDVRHTQGIQS